MSTDNDAYTLNDKGLKKLLKAFKSAPPTARVGILGQTNSRSGGETGNQTNAEIGAKHEFGDSEMPIRSFLRTPLADHLESELENAGLFEEKTIKDIMATGSFLEMVKKMGLVGESVVIEAFNTGGYGKWPGWRSGYTNKSGQLLVDTQQLRNSITSDVVQS